MIMRNKRRVHGSAVHIYAYDMGNGMVIAL